MFLCICLPRGGGRLFWGPDLGTHIGTGGTGMVPIKGRCGVGIPMPCGCFQTQAASPRPPHGGVGAAPCPQIVPTDVLLTCSPLCRSWLQLAPASGSHFGAGGGHLPLPTPSPCSSSPLPGAVPPLSPSLWGWSPVGASCWQHRWLFWGLLPRARPRQQMEENPKGQTQRNSTQKSPSHSFTSFLGGRVWEMGWEQLCSR